MFQYEWVDKNIHKKHDISNTVKHQKHILPIEYIRILHWEEHCLECGAPECYESCLNYVRRFNTVLCRRLTYGFYNNKRIKKESRNLFAVDIRFEKWGKMASSIYSGAVRPKYIAGTYRIIQIVAMGGGGGGEPQKETLT
jgi:hypothetical protein